MAAAQACITAASCHTLGLGFSNQLATLTACCLHAEERLHTLALRLDRSALIKEKRSRLLQAIRQTYNDFFHNYFITGDHCFRLRVSGVHRLAPLSFSGSPCGSLATLQT